jgi:ribosomal protein S27AE
MSKQTPTEGAIHSTEVCPHCKDKGLMLQTHSSGEQVGSCGRCGYSFVRRVVTNDKGEPLQSFEGKLQYITEAVDNPFGAVHLIDNGNVAQMYAVDTELRYQDVIIPFIEQHRSEIKEAKLSQWRFGEYVITDILKTLKPDSYGDPGQQPQ